MFRELPIFPLPLVLFPGAPRALHIADILTEGERRFLLLEWCPDERLYRMARVEEFEDDPVPPGEAATIAADVRHGFLRLTEALRTLAGNDFEEPLEPLTVEAQQRAAVRERGKRNGRGGAHSHIAPPT